MTLIFAATPAGTSRRRYFEARRLARLAHEVGPEHAFQLCLAREHKQPLGGHKLLLRSEARPQLAQRQPRCLHVQDEAPLAGPTVPHALCNTFRWGRARVPLIRPMCLTRLV